MKRKSSKNKAEEKRNYDDDDDDEDPNQLSHTLRLFLSTSIYVRTYIHRYTYICIYVLHENKYHFYGIDNNYSNLPNKYLTSSRVNEILNDNCMVSTDWLNMDVIYEDDSATIRDENICNTQLLTKVFKVIFYEYITRVVIPNLYNC